MPTLQKKTVTKKSATKKAATKAATKLATKPATKVATKAATKVAIKAVAATAKRSAPPVAGKAKAAANPKAAAKAKPTKVTATATIKAAAKPAVSKGSTVTRTAAPTAPSASAPVSSTLVAVAAKAPDFTLPDASGKLVTLSAFRGKPVVLYFYPKDDTTGCTQEACDFRDNLAAFRKAGCTVLGVSPDPVKSHAKFAAKHALTITLLADEPGAGGTPAVCAQYGVWQEKSMYGRAYMGVVRTTYVIDGAGKVARRFDKVSVTGHVDEVLAVVRALH
jgi:peroxiredoxin Q/BCP